MQIARRLFSGLKTQF